MSDRIHRASMFVGGLTTGFIGIAGVGNLVSPLVLGWVGLVGATVLLGGNLWRIYFPDTPKT